MTSSGFEVNLTAIWVAARLNHSIILFWIWLPPQVDGYLHVTFPPKVTWAGPKTLYVNQTWVCNRDKSHENILKSLSYVCLPVGSYWVCWLNCSERWETSPSKYLTGKIVMGQVVLYCRCNHVHFLGVIQQWLHMKSCMLSSQMFTW